MVSIQKTEQENALLGLCDQYLSQKGFRTIDVDCHLGPKSLIRVFLERGRKGESPTEPTATVEDCAEASRILATVLDSEEWITGRYDLEVSSPGLDRRLRVRSDFESVVGEEIKLHLAQCASPTEKIMALTGRLLNLDGEKLIIDFSGRTITVPIFIVKRAQRVWHFSSSKVS